MKHLQKLLVVLAIIIISLICYNSYSDDKEDLSTTNIEKNESNETMYPIAAPTESKNITLDEHAAKLEEDKKNIAPDQDKIVQQIKDIDSQDNEAHHLLKTDDLNQLFNNFVYFKNFIVHNFDKDKIVRLCIEFINQIYPETHKKTITVAAEKSTTTTKHEEHHVEQMPTPAAEPSNQQQDESSDQGSQPDQSNQSDQTSGDSQSDQSSQDTGSDSQDA
ncbi:MAG: hypothetical protein JO129_00015 [Candidatus Dependentiae bacterium]|nr:hypothetical protein [Candidatus Dependentiae bacterium]